MRRVVSKLIQSKPGTVQSGNGQDISNYKIDFSSVKDFYISLDDPHKSWLPGDEIAGKIILVSKKNLANILLTLSLIGYVKVNSISHSKLRPVKHSLFHHTISIYGEEQNSSSSAEFENGLYKGEHRFPFIVKLPVKRIFTSIDFGKGSIKYILRASIGDLDAASLVSPSIQASSPESPVSPNGVSIINKTRNLKILQNANYTCEKIINLVKPIDVSKLPIPKPKRFIIKDPRRSKMLSRTQSSTSTINTFNTIDTLSSNNSDSATANDNNSNINTPSSNPTTPGEATKPDTIRVCLDIPEKGYIRGESIPVKITINHLKKIQDLNGIIVTFVRVCRLDNGTDGLFESFRKDLQQVIIPLYVDPVTYQSEINTSIRVPADAFPTISGCPLVSFQYFIEVLINLSGKSLAIDNKDGLQSNKQPDESLDLKMSGDFKFNFNSGITKYSVERSGFVNTDRYKRMKKFLQMTSEVIIGSCRSGIKKDNSKNNEDNENRNPNSNPNSPAINNQSGSSPMTHPEISNTPQISNHSDSSDNILTPPYVENSSLHTDFNMVPTYYEIESNSLNSDIVSFPQQRQLSEKEQMRAHEESLLPSEPPPDIEIEAGEATESNSVRRNDFLEHISESDELPQFYGNPMDILNSDSYSQLENQEEPDVTSLSAGMDGSDSANT